MWTLRDLSTSDEVWVNFKSHHDVSERPSWPVSVPSTCHGDRRWGACNVLASIWDKRGKGSDFEIRDPPCLSPYRQQEPRLSCLTSSGLLGDRPFIVFYNHTDYGSCGVPLTGVFVSLAFPPIFHRISCSRDRPGTLRETPSCRLVVQGRLVIFSQFRRDY